MNLQQSRAIPESQTACMGNIHPMAAMSETQEIFLAHQPILDVHQEIAAYELLFRSGHHGACTVTDDMAASATVILNTFGHFGTERILGRHRGFINQALVVLGRRQLQRWIQLLIYTVGDASSRNTPLLQLAASRGRLMELLAKEQRPGNKDFHERAFMVGILSLLDILLDLPMPEILSQLSLNSEVSEALLSHGGALGQLLSLTEYLEVANFDAAAEIMAKADIPLAVLTEAQLETFSWVGNLDREKA